MNISKNGSVSFFSSFESKADEFATSSNIKGKMNISQEASVCISYSLESTASDFLRSSDIT
jgi:hypothetical protein